MSGFVLRAAVTAQKTPQFDDQANDGRVPWIEAHY